MVYKILFVDDEKDILSSLRRLFMEDWCEIFTASSGQEALELIKKESVDLIVSDQRMPAMEGVEFLKQSKKYAPDSIRILLTGYADVNAAIDSINEGGVSRYFTKPWNNDELKEAIHDALELRKLRNENERLLELTGKQNLELKDLNTNLEKKVKEQTKDLRKMLFEVKKLNGELDESLMNTVKVLSNVTCMKTRSDPASFKNVSKLSKAIAQERKLARNEIRDVEVAALVYDIGVIGTCDSILNKPFANMVSSERLKYMKHPMLGHAVLESIENMQDVGVIVKYHHERWDGEGYPDNLIGNEIPVGSRIIAVASDYIALIDGTLMPSKFTSSEAKQFIIESSNKRYEPEVVELFLKILPEMEKIFKESSEYKLSSSEIKVGMLLAKDIYTENGLRLLNEGQVITERHIKNIINFEESEGRKYEIYISSKPVNQ